MSDIACEGIVDGDCVMGYRERYGSTAQVLLLGMLHVTIYEQAEYVSHRRGWQRIHEVLLFRNCPQTNFRKNICALFLALENGHHK